ncbi:MAG TPA: T9SS type A sorting domain-containing protein [Ignavibacteria bacterium]
MIYKITKTLIFFFIFIGISHAQVKITSYNLLGYPGTDTATRHPYYRTVISSINPDILVVQEMASQAGVNGFLNGVMNYYGNFYSPGIFIDGPDTDQEIFYKTSLFIFLSNTPIHTALRDINEFKIVHITTHDTLRIYSVHLKASTGTANELARAAEVDSLRKVTNTLPPNSYFIVCGDFNFYSANEPAYQKLLQITAGNDGNFNDPLNMPGSWQDNPAYSAYHTQSTRVRAFGGGATGGLDDRFDMILYSNGIKNPGGITYVTNSLTPYGNDGNHLNDSINQPPNTAVSQTVANALHYSSDHLPVYELFTFTSSVSINFINSNEPPIFKLYPNYPNPVNPTTNIKFDIPQNSLIKIKIFDILGKEIATLVNENLNAGSYSVNWSASNYGSGVYFYRLETESFIDTKRMVIVK